MPRALLILSYIMMLAILLAVASSPALAQVAVVKRNVNLRVDPSSWQEPVRLLTPPEEMSVLDNLRQVNGYYHVITSQNEVGWVWSRNVTVDPNRTLGVLVEPVVYHGCPPEGNAIPQAVKNLNVLKNRYKASQPADVDANISLTSPLAPGDDEHRWQSGQAAELTGFVFDVKVGGVETANCRATTKEFRDTHIELVLSATDSGPKRRVIVEVTPRWRDAEAQHGTDWSTDTLKATLKGHTVNVRGWLLFDQEHADESENTKPGRAANWRGTAWEVHPITSIEVVQ